MRQKFSPLGCRLAAPVNDGRQAMALDTTRPQHSRLLRVRQETFDFGTGQTTEVQIAWRQTEIYFARFRRVHGCAFYGEAVRLDRDFIRSRGNGNFIFAVVLRKAADRFYP